MILLCTFEKFISIEINRLKQNPFLPSFVSILKFRMQQIKVELKWRMHLKNEPFPVMLKLSIYLSNAMYRRLRIE